MLYLLRWNAPWWAAGVLAIATHQSGWIAGALVVLANVFGYREGRQQRLRQQEFIDHERRKALRTAAEQLGQMEAFIITTPLILGEVPDGAEQLADSHQRIVEALEAGRDIDWGLESGVAASAVEQMRSYIADYDND
jgi:hypothetical protein